ncbi:DNA (cytosine-5-)-methyltransferase [Candidatus Giovannonibacteria bacterium RIFCSPLOWO2_12_FULL_44_25]|uniref:Cytosine-specific methyltransferase n=1 Tax=Candidatus Giovannonibacteria bacterium RIFCSPHIGHO2_02_FULL_45_40 TaxID=1798337 RepID=A0A1F5WAQ8_9BACT|nr:MAG: DNA (cytosine-5-)-methyltransferase [Candidatus Giovannonibacteria bacterium GWA2_45_15]OGF59672.1 MAG: DNA (cytosine-5-)-methyltransferase [Candidatus Giovannonibacteria bacterium RIFCSPHIGHO2_01_45_12]OGF60403.1 MAG: DNA (cytosine-5-)-methyltransferase [Candidatus Giovannonibacteria bacterium RIFCSPHIGHO2_01_FULL_44_100]OGF72723.1 MAG: DNA (cytosine-5-)-methyltransferase [Candidatus Giovannonibacteria bacterium RIFCSPHIGHO2_02_FULL_45_40]OGF83849.1 MAG: DNA (cytosine-5-)-methyltransfe
MVLELCAGGGGQALGLELAGFEPIAVVEIDPRFCETLRFNRPYWNVIKQDIKTLSGGDFAGVDLIAGGVPCPPFSFAGKQLGEKDERDLFPTALRIIDEARPRAVLLENVPGFMSAKFVEYRNKLQSRLEKMGYKIFMTILNASDFGVPQLRPRFVLVGLQKKYAENFSWPEKKIGKKTVGETLKDLMVKNGWKHAESWAEKAADIGPTIVGGSVKHGGPDLGPTRTRAQWLKLSVNGIGIADEAPSAKESKNHIPKITVKMAARIQGFPDWWHFVGPKTTAYKQIGNAFPPPVAHAVGLAIKKALES